MDENLSPTPDEIDDALTGVEDIEELRTATPEQRQVAFKLLPFVTRKANVAAEANYAKKLQETVNQLTEESRKMMAAEIDNFRKANKPPTPKEIQTLLTQEYAEFKVLIMERKGKNEREFTIREMPQATEMKFLRIIQKSMVPHLKELSSVEWTNGLSVAEKLQRVIDIIPEALDMLAECCSIALDPYEELGVTKDWVQKNLSSFRIMNIIESQIIAGRFRDFFSALSRSIPGQMTA